MTKLSNATDSTKDFSDETPIIQSKRTFYIELTVSIIYTLIKLVLIGIVTGFMLSLSLSSFKNSPGYLRAQENIWVWEQEIIVDFRVVDTVNCPQEWEEFANYSWPGNAQGCSCSFQIGLFQYNAILEGRCSQREFDKGCTSVPFHNPIPFQFWKSNAHLCVKRLHNYNFYSSESNIINPNNYKIINCSQGKQYQIDLIEPIPCPVTNMVNNNSFEESIPELNLTYIREENYPLVYFRVSQFSFCESLGDNNKSPGRTSNYILQSNYQYECIQKDSRTILVDSQGEADFFSHNPRIEAVISTLPAYPHLSNQYRYNLGFVRYPAWTYSCRNSQTYKLTTATQYLSLSDLEPAIIRLQLLALVSTLCSLVFMGYYWITCYFHLKTKHMHGYLYLKDYQIRMINPHTNIIKNRTAEIAKFIAYQASPIFTIMFLLILYYRLNSAKTWFTDAIKCTQGSFIDYLKSYEQFFGGDMVITLSSIFLNLSLICLDVCYMLWRYFKGDLQDAQVEEDQIQKDQLSQKMGQDGCNLKPITVTQEFLVDNTFAIDPQNSLNIYTFEEDEKVVSEYSQSSKSD